ncbi:MAG: SH3 domain-containing protein [Eubacteriales bacterium]|nr:SH3 domain-containing protein [Eubacteriales bacterium]
MSIRIGHAVMDENGKTIGLTPGDQTGKEIALATWYAKNKSGRVWQYYLECTDSAMAERAARYMEQICVDSAFGYSQGKTQRWDGYRSIRANGGVVSGAHGDFDCSSLVISCYIFAGLNLQPDGYTGNLRAKLLATGKFQSYSDSAHIGSDKLAKRGGVYLRSGHVLMALEDGGGAVTAEETSDLKVVGKIVVDEIRKWCNVRSGPGMEYTILGKAKKDDVFNIYGVVEDWYRIDFNGTVGYLYGDLASEVLPGNV